MAPNHYDNQWCPGSLTHVFVIKLQCVQGGAQISTNFSEISINMINVCPIYMVSAKLRPFCLSMPQCVSHVIDVTLNFYHPGGCGFVHVGETFRSDVLSEFVDCWHIWPGRCAYDINHQLYRVKVRLHNPNIYHVQLGFSSGSAWVLPPRCALDNSAGMLSNYAWYMDGYMKQSNVTTNCGLNPPTMVVNLSNTLVCNTPIS